MYFTVIGKGVMVRSRTEKGKFAITTLKEVRRRQGGGSESVFMSENFVYTMTVLLHLFSANECAKIFWR